MGRYGAGPTRQGAQVPERPVPSPTPRLAFRSRAYSDLDDLAALLSDPHVMRHYPRIKTREEALDWIEWN
ncbi:GNAT family N-acetyltransferase [Streptomyces sp. HUAS MG91]|uniref:GNAT family N-acetyltransferase n=1 Tax=Streptomyces tabacisoli TaxID=3156398 RepID=A0AAU8IK25_9ACTN